MRHRGSVQQWVGAFVVAAAAAVAAASAGIGAIKSQDLKEWLTYVASDELQGRATYGSGIGLAASYIEDHLRSWGVKPAGDHGGYLQTVRVLGVKTTSRSSVTVEVAGEARTFADGDGITLPKNMGLKLPASGQIMIQWNHDNATGGPAQDGTVVQFCTVAAGGRPD